MCRIFKKMRYTSMNCLSIPNTLQQIHSFHLAIGNDIQIWGSAAN